LELVEQRSGLEVADWIISRSNLATGGAYTAVGTYDSAEMVELLTRYCQKTGASSHDMLQHLGQKLFQHFVKTCPEYFVNVHSTFKFLEQVERVIHVEVRKLYPDAELPRFRCETEQNVMKVHYHSSRPFADLAAGLIAACARHFDEPLRIEWTLDGAQDGTSAMFVLTAESALASATNLAHGGLLT
jgi:hypothetical protein